jgi:putative transposase
MIALALEAEVDEYVAAFADVPDEAGHRLVVRNGRAREREDQRHRSPLRANGSV